MENDPELDQKVFSALGGIHQWSEHRTDKVYSGVSCLFCIAWKGSPGGSVSSPHASSPCPGWTRVPEDGESRRWAEGWKEWYVQQREKNGIPITHDGA